MSRFPRSECRPGQHLVDGSLERCTECGWLDPDVRRCDVDGCIYPAEYEAEVGPKGEGPEFTTIIQSGAFCDRHALLGGISLVPGPSA